MGDVQEKTMFSRCCQSLPGSGLFRRLRHWLRSHTGCLWPLTARPPQGTEQPRRQPQSSTLESTDRTHEEATGIVNGHYGNGSMLYLAEVCAMRTLQPDTKEMLLDALVPGPLGKRICYFNTFLCTYSDFSTIPYYLDQIFDRNMALCLQSCKAKYKAKFCNRTDLPLLKMKVGSKQVRLPRGDLQTHACFLRVRMAYPNPTQAEAVAPALFARLQSCQTLALEPDSPLLTELEPLLETGSISKLRLPPCAESAPKTTTKVSCACPGPANNQPRKMASITTFPAKLLAEQFTLMDAELFQNVVPYQCHSSIRIQQNKEVNAQLPPTVLAVIIHYHHVAHCVTTTCLGDPSMKAEDRARVVEHWIKVAKECLALRNYCSVHTILCALQSHPVRQLKTTWGEVSRKSARKFQRLCTQDKKVNRDVPMKGAVPFLGTFIMYLDRLDIAMKDFVDGKNNMLKMTKEIKVLQEMQRLQVAASQYTLLRDAEFALWFQSMERLSDTKR
uniref:Ras-GEF domain-containing protein n=1 Tax=Oryctolagus cuniculus TaxID=9986 RepID=A0A5F9CXD0_RABIT